MTSARRTHPRPLVAQIEVDQAEVGDLEVLAVRVDEEQATVQLAGELDLATSALLADVVDRELSRGRRFLRLDLSRLDFSTAPACKRSWTRNVSACARPDCWC